MSLISCPKCGKQISDKAIICPHCKIDVQKALAEVREEQKQKQEKRKRRIFISIFSFSVMATLSVLAYLYYIDALNSIPSEYRKQTEGYFEYCESAIINNDFTRGNYYVNSLKKRTFTNRQAQHFEKSEMAVAKVGLCDLENMLASVANNSGTKIDDDVLRRIKEVISILDTYQLDISQIEHLKKAKEKLAELILTAIEKRVGLQDGDRQVKYTFEVTNRLFQELQKMELSTTQSTRLETAMKEAEKTKKLEEENQHKQLLKTIRDEYIRLLEAHKPDDPDYGYDDGYFLYDINNDNIPEIWIKSGGYSTGSIYVYTYYNNGISLIYDDGAGHSSFHKGDGYVLVAFGHMGHAMWHKLTYNGTSITSTKIFEEYTDGDYKDPEEKYINLYPLTNKQPILNAFK